jgi:hypothetical protein
MQNIVFAIGLQTNILHVSFLMQHPRFCLDFDENINA